VSYFFSHRHLYAGSTLHCVRKLVVRLSSRHRDKHRERGALFLARRDISTATSRGNLRIQHALIEKPASLRTGLAVPYCSIRKWHLGEPVFPFGGLPLIPPPWLPRMSISFTGQQWMWETQFSVVYVYLWTSKEVNLWS
jgi:hypothetical protein